MIKFQLSSILIIIVTMTLLASDIFDIYAKTTKFTSNYVGGLRSTEIFHLKHEPLRLKHNPDSISQQKGNQNRSGWLSISSQCESIYAASSVFSTIVGKSCQLGTSVMPLVAPKVVFTANQEVDTILYSACNLLNLVRRPPICYQSNIFDLEKLKGMDIGGVFEHHMLDPYTNSEKEVLGLLDLLSRSHPIQDIVCVEGFQYWETGDYTPLLIGCGSPNTEEAAFVGLQATSFSLVHKRYSGEFVNTLEFRKNLDISVRRQISTKVRVIVNRETNSISIHRTASLSVSLFGSLFIVVIAIDLALLIVNIQGLLSLWHLLPPPKTTQSNDCNSISTLEYSLLLTKSLSQHNVIAVLTVLSGMSSWILIYQCIYFWKFASVYLRVIWLAYITTRLWCPIICWLNLICKAVAWLWELGLYKLACRTYLSYTNIVVCTFLTALYECQQQPNVPAYDFWGAEKSIVDTLTFQNYTARAVNNLEIGDKGLAELVARLQAITTEIISLCGIILVLKAIYIQHTNPKLKEFTDKIYERDHVENLLQTPMRSCILVRPMLIMQTEQITPEKSVLSPIIPIVFGLHVQQHIARIRTVLHIPMYPSVGLVKYPVKQIQETGVTNEQDTEIDELNGPAFNEVLPKIHEPEGLIQVKNAFVSYVRRRKSVDEQSET